MIVEQIKFETSALVIYVTFGSIRSVISLTARLKSMLAGWKHALPLSPNMTQFKPAHSICGNGRIRFSFIVISIIPVC